MDRRPTGIVDWRQAFIMVVSMLIAALAAGCAHLVISAAAATVMASHEQRLFNVPQFPDAEQSNELIGGYLASRVKPDSVVVAGSSFSFGYPFPPELAFPNFLAAGTVNASVIGGDLARISSGALCEMRERGLHAKAIVVEVPLINETFSLKAPDNDITTCPQSQGRSLFSYALRHPVGVQWFRLLDDPYSNSRDRTKISIAKVAAGYFVTREQFATETDRLVSRVKFVWDLASSISDRPFMFITPVYIPGVAEAGFDAPTVREQFEFAQAACRQLAGPGCIDTSVMLERRDLFSNITHLNGAGAVYLGQLAARQLSSGE